MYLLAKNPEKQEKLREEVKSLPVDSNGRLTPSSFLTVPYLRYVHEYFVALSYTVRNRLNNARFFFILIDELKSLY